MDSQARKFDSKLLKASMVSSINGWPLWPWFLVAIFAVINLIWLTVSDTSLSPSSVSNVALLITAIAVTGWTAYQLRNFDITFVLLAGASYILFAGPVFRVFNHLSMTLAFPWADNWLSAIDANLGFDWLSFLIWLDNKDTLLSMMDASYLALDKYSATFYIFFAAISERRKACFELIALFALASIFCMVIGMFVPAQAAMTYYAPDLSEFRNLHANIGVYHIEPFTYLRGDVPPVLSLSDLPGLVTFPSFHTAMGVVLIYVARWRWWLFVPSLAINLLMIGSTLVFGSHYFIDLIGGTAVTLLAIAILRKIQNISNLDRDVRGNQTFKPLQDIPLDAEPA